MLNTLTPSQIVRTGAEYGAYACITYIVYFIIMRLIGMATVIELHYVNYVFLLVAVYYAALKAETLKKWRLKYLQAFIVIFITGALSFVFFCIFLLIYSQFDPIVITTFNEFFTGSESMGDFAVPILVASEGIALTSIVSLGMAFLVQEHARNIKKSSGEVLVYKD